MKKAVVVFWSLMISVGLYAQSYDLATTTGESWDTIIPPINHGILTVSIGGGATSFDGDLGFGKNITSLNNFRGGIKFGVERRLGKKGFLNFLGVGGYALFGQLAQNERSISRNLNFQSSFKQFGIEISGHGDMKSTTRFAPFGSVGAALFQFDSYGDLKDSQGQEYYYWTDGEIRNLPEFDKNGRPIPDNYTLSTELKRDYFYETQYNQTSDIDSIANYSKSGYAFPITLGVKVRMHEFIEARVFGSYTFTTTDFIDNYSNGNPDKYWFAGVQVLYTIGKKWVHPHEKPYDNEVLKTVPKTDTDGDGVSDFEDECANSPKGKPVDSKGCPLDDDKDGVPNYMDREPNTKKGALVDHYGVTLTEEDLVVMEQKRKGLYFELKRQLTETVDSLNESGGSLTSHEIEDIYGDVEPNVVKPMPKTFWFADQNEDAVLQVREITYAIDCFFEGSEECPGITGTNIMEMIDFFFEGE